MTQIDYETQVSDREHSKAVDEIWKLFESPNTKSNPELRTVLGETGAAHLAAAPNAFDKDKEPFYIKGFYPYADDDQKKIILARAHTLIDDPKNSKDIRIWFRDINILLPVFDEEQQTTILRQAAERLNDPNLEMGPYYNYAASGRLLQHTKAHTEERAAIFRHFISNFDLLAKRDPKHVEARLFMLKNFDNDEFKFDITQAEREAINKVIADAGKFNLTNLLGRVGLPNPFEAKHTNQ